MAPESMLSVVSCRLSAKQLHCEEAQTTDNRQLITRSSPDRAAPVRGARHLPAVRAVPCVLELGHVLNREVHACGSRRMRIRQRPPPPLLGRHRLAPHLREAEKEALFGRVAVEGDAWLAFEGFLV